MRLYILHVHPKNAAEMCFAGWVRGKTRNFAAGSFAGRRHGAAHFSTICSFLPLYYLR